MNNTAHFYFRQERDFNFILNRIGMVVEVIWIVAR